MVCSLQVILAPNPRSKSIQVLLFQFEMFEKLLVAFLLRYSTRIYFCFVKHFHISALTRIFFGLSLQVHSFGNSVKICTALIITSVFIFGFDDGGSFIIAVFLCIVTLAAVIISFLFYYVYIPLAFKIMNWPIKL